MSQTNTSDALSYIAHTFAEAYYGLLVDPENFSKLHTFYQLDAVFTRGDEAIGQADASTTTGLEGIKKELATFHHQVRNSEVTLKVMDSQYSVNQGIVITAVGSFNRLEGAAVKTRRFVQTFFLEAQTPHNYSIRNDMLRYLHETPQQVVVAAKEEPKSQPTVTPAPTSTVNGSEAHTATTAPVAEGNGEAKKQPQGEKRKPAATATATTTATAGSPTAARKGRQTRKGDDKKSRDTKPEHGQEQPAAKPSKPTTYATIVSGNAATTAPSVTEQPKTKVGFGPKQQQPQVQQQAQQQQQQAKPIKEKKPRQEREGHSVYVGNLPFEAASEQVYNLFAKFVTIKDIALKRGYGFVDLTSAEDLKKVLDHFAEHPVTLDGRPLVIEDRNRGAKSNAPRAQGQSQPKPAGAKRSIKTGGKSNDNAAH
eukprot:TRINITY_DN3095_c0_g1_i1.p1 TRINITY_DN3095_c0_g1~~TRINITY_DN3095_c0_g1_i1.p1  ORF type:complete len:424 (-),score=171.03 TRINITY_DN3095_c0_g1_i1:163-1434(-)